METRLFCIVGWQWQKDDTYAHGNRIFVSEAKLGRAVQGILRIKPDIYAENNSSVFSIVKQTPTKNGIILLCGLSYKAWLATQTATETKILCMLDWFLKQSDTYGKDSLNFVQLIGGEDVEEEQGTRKLRVCFSVGWWLARV